MNTMAAQLPSSSQSAHGPALVPRWSVVACMLMLLLLPAAFVKADPPAKEDPAHGEAASAQSGAAQNSKIRPIRVAVFDIDVSSGINIEPGALTDQLNTILATMPKVTIVNRDQIRRVAEEHQIALSGLVDGASAVKVGKFVSAQYLVVGRASKIGQTFYLVLRMIDVETTEQSTISAKGNAEQGFDAVLNRLNASLVETLKRLQQPVVEPEDKAFAELRKLIKPLQGKTLLVEIEETHVNRPLVDPAAQMAVAQRLRSLGLNVVVPKDPMPGWKDTLLETGRYGQKKIDYLLEGEGVSGLAAQIQGLVSCRARVELRLIGVPGREVNASDRGVAAGADLVESLAAKTALEAAGVQACDAIIHRLSETRSK